MSYVWSAIDSLPAGITLSSGGVIAGGTTSPVAGAYYRIQVTDGVSTGVANLWIEVLPKDVAIPIVYPLSELAIGLQFGAEFTSLESLTARSGFFTGVTFGTATGSNLVGYKPGVTFGVFTPPSFGSRLGVTFGNPATSAAILNRLGVTFGTGSPFTVSTKQGATFGTATGAPAVAIKLGAIFT